MDASTSVLDALEGQLGPDTIQKISSQLGTDTAATAHAVSMAVPILLGRLSKNAANAEGAAALDTALDAHDGSILDNIGSLVGSGGAGSAILTHILGSLRTPVEEGVGRAAGLNAQQVGQVLSMLAPVVMGVLGRMKRTQSVGADQLPVVLGQANLEMARQSNTVGNLSQLLDGSHDEQLADDVARIGSEMVGGMLRQSARA
jgi:hypothetical protein